MTVEIRYYLVESKDSDGPTYWLLKRELVLPGGRVAESKEAARFATQAEFELFKSLCGGSVVHIVPPGPPSPAFLPDYFSRLIEITV